MSVKFSETRDYGVDCVCVREKERKREAQGVSKSEHDVDLCEIH